MVNFRAVGTAFYNVGARVAGDLTSYVTVGGLKGIVRELGALRWTGKALAILAGPVAGAFAANVAKSLADRVLPASGRAHVWSERAANVVGVVTALVVFREAVRYFVSKVALPA